MWNTLNREARPYVPGSFTARSWISCICWQWHSESLLIKWNALLGLDEPSLHMAARTGAHSFRSAKEGLTIGSCPRPLYPAQRSRETQRRRRSVFWSIQVHLHGIPVRKHPLWTENNPAVCSYYPKVYLISHTLNYREISSSLLCHVSTRHLFPIITQLVIQSRSHEAAIIGLQIMWNHFDKNMSQNSCDGGSVCPHPHGNCVGFFFENRLIGGWIWLGYTPAPLMLLGGGRLRSLAVILTVWWCAREAVGLLLRAAQPVNRWGRHTVSRPAESTRRRWSSSSVLR